jgi:hypothetical protein
MWLQVSNVCIDLQNDTFSMRYVTLEVKKIDRYIVGYLSYMNKISKVKG